MKPMKVLIVEDDALIALDLKQRMQDQGHTILEICDSGIAAMDAVKEHRPELVFMDIRLRGQMTGLEAARIIQHDCPTHILFLTANPHLVQPFIADSWFKNCLVISKPASETELADGIRKLFMEG